jgi:glycine/D-amino acid oxidase-like deaminating enzyme
VAIGVQALLAEVALAAKDVEGHQHAVADLDLGDFVADLFDDSHELMAEGVAHARVRHETVVQMQIRTADAGARHAHDGITGMFDDGLWFLGHANPIWAAVGHCKHGISWVHAWGESVSVLAL